MTTIGIVGLGLIGGSIALAAQRAGHPVVSWDVDSVTREEAAEKGLTVSPDLSAADLIVLALPLGALTDGLAATLARVRISAAATITDVGSLKQPVAAAMRSATLTGRYVGGHPMAGTERTGFTAATPDLIVGARWVLCLDGDDSDDRDDRVSRWLQVAALVTDLGAVVLALTPAEHDTAMAMVSGVPHLLALALSMSAESSGPIVRALAAGSFADLTRVAASSPTLLHAVTEGNSPAVRAALRLVLEQLDRPWHDLVEDGHAARQHARGRPEAGLPAGGGTEATVSGARALLDLGRAGAVIEAVDPVTRVIRHRHPAPR